MGFATTQAPHMGTKNWTRVKGFSLIWDCKSEKELIPLVDDKRCRSWMARKVTARSMNSPHKMICTMLAGMNDSIIRLSGNLINPLAKSDRMRIRSLFASGLIKLPDNLIMESFMPANIVQIILWGLFILLAVTFLAIQLRHRLSSTKGINSFSDLQSHINENPFTLVQFFVPM